MNSNKVQESFKNDLLKQGYSSEDIEKAWKAQGIETYEEPEEEEEQVQQQMSTFAYNPTDNLVKWQLELNDILERAEHILKEDIVVRDKSGNSYWAPNPDTKARIFNDYGVQEILRILSMYVNRNTILSDYEPTEIKEKVLDFGMELNNLLYMKYELFGLDGVNKRKNYPMLVREMVDIVHSAYKRAQHGGEKRSLREARQIQQTEQIIPQGYNPQTGQFGKERSAINPLRYVKGKF